MRPARKSTAPNQRTSAYLRASDHPMIRDAANKFRCPPSLAARPRMHTYLIGATERISCRIYRRLPRQRPVSKLRKSVSKKGTKPKNNTKPKVALFERRPSGYERCGSPKRPQNRRLSWLPSRLFKAVAGAGPSNEPNATPPRAKSARHRRRRDARVQPRARIAKQRSRWRMYVSFRVMPENAYAASLKHARAASLARLAHSAARARSSLVSKAVECVFV
jgi:hypothetical protein